MMAKRKSQWDKYLKLVNKLISDSPTRNPTSIARQINREKNLNLSKKQLDLFRMYISRVRKRSKLAPLKPNCTEVRTDSKNDTTWDVKEESAVWSYDGTQSITSLEQAIDFSGVDMEEWEVERHVFNSWDVTMKVDEEPIKRTNYQVKVWFRRKEKLEIERPEFRNIKIEVRKDMQMWVTIGCVHRPFHDKLIWDKFLKFLEVNREEITGVIIDGDYLDLRSLSSHEEWIPEGIDLSYEYSDGLQGIQDIESRLKPDVEKIYIYGNHEDRFFRDKKSIRKYGSSLPSPHEAMELEERGWQVITDWKNGYVTLGNNLDVFHGVKVGMNAAKDQLQAIPDRDHIFFHTHRFGSHSNKTNTAYNAGCMIDFDHEVFKYVDRGIRQSWSHGFAVAYIDAKGNNHVYPIKIDNDKGFFFKGNAF
jgi:hypothetical protein